MQSRIAWIFLSTWFLVHQGDSKYLEEPCGYSITAKIVNGNDAWLQDAAWMTAIRNATDFICGGTLIHKRFVLTAAHCIRKNDTLFVRLGAYNKNHAMVQKSVTRALVHRLYTGHSNDGNDIGLLKLSSSVNYNVYIHPICIILDKSFKNTVETRATFKAFGWGLKKHDGQESEILQTVVLNNLNRDVCSRGLLSNVSSIQICAGYSSGDTCAGDSGGPLTNTISFNEGTREVQFGIVSFGSRYCDGLGVYTDVTSYVDWIEDNIKKFDTVDASQSSVIPLQPRRDMWLYGDCGGNTIASHLQANIYGPNFMTQGVMITDRFVLTNARGLPESAVSLEVGVLRMQNTYEAYRVIRVFKNQGYFRSNNGIALLQLNRPVKGPDGLKPICMLANLRDQQEAVSTPYFTVLDYGRIQTFAFTVSLTNPNQCSNRIQRGLEPNQLCVETPRGISPYFGKPGDVLGKTIVHSGKKWFVLLGIVSYSSNGLYVFNNVLRHTEWIVNIIHFN